MGGGGRGGTCLTGCVQTVYVERKVLWRGVLEVEEKGEEESKEYDGEEVKRMAERKVGRTVEMKVKRKKRQRRRR